MAEPATDQHVVRGGKEGGLNRYNYSYSGAVAGYGKCDDNAGEVGMTGEGGDHFSAAMGRGNYGHPQPKTQV